MANRLRLDGVDGPLAGVGCRNALSRLAQDAVRALRMERIATASMRLRDSGPSAIDALSDGRGATDHLRRAVCQFCMDYNDLVKLNGVARIDASEAYGREWDSLAEAMSTADEYVSNLLEIFEGAPLTTLVSAVQPQIDWLKKYVRERSADIVRESIPKMTA